MTLSDWSLNWNKLLIVFDRIFGVQKYLDSNPNKSQYVLFVKIFLVNYDGKFENLISNNPNIIDKNNNFNDYHTVVINVVQRRYQLKTNYISYITRCQIYYHLQ